MSRPFIISTPMLSLIAALVLSGCSSEPAPQENPDNQMAQVHVQIGGEPQASPRVLKQHSASNGIPAEVSKIVIEVLDSRGRHLDSADLLLTGSVTLTIPAGKNYTINGRAMAGSELLFSASTLLATIGAGSQVSVSLSLEEQVALSISSFGDQNIGATSVEVSYSVDGLNNTNMTWLVNNIEGGNAEIGTINTNGHYTPPTTLPSNPIITLTAVPIVAPSFAQSISFTLLPPANQAPIAIAGSDQTVTANATVNLDGSASSDADDGIASYQWQLVGGDFSPTLLNANSAIAFFTAPTSQYGGSVTLQLNVTDNSGDSHSDNVIITITGTDQPLSADAGADQVVDENTLVTLDGSASTDPDNTIVQYRWEELSDSGVVLSNANTQQATFTAPAITVSTALQFRLTITNDHGEEAQAVVNISISSVALITDKIFFAASTNLSSYSLWVTDGTEANTQQVSTVNVSNFDFPQFINYNGFLYFEGSEASTGRELWRSDGTLSGTQLIPTADDTAYSALGASASVYPSSLTLIGDHILYGANTSYNTFYSSEFISLDTNNLSLSSVFPNGRPTTGNGAINHTGVMAGYTYFHHVVYTPSISSSLYRTDGLNPAQLVKSSDVLYSHVHDFVEMNGQLYFSWGFNELWKTDGTEAGTVLIKAFSGHIGHSSSYSGQRNMVALGNQLIFVADDGQGRELWRSDGTTAGTVLVKDLDNTIASTNPTEFTLMNNELFFISAAGNASTDGLWKTDGTSSGTTRLSAVRPAFDGYYTGIGSAQPVVVSALNRLFFAADNGSSGMELWTSDGTISGTVQVLDIRTGAASSSPAMFHAGSQFLLFIAEDDDGRAKLWRSDGTPGGTTLIKDINPNGFGRGAFFPFAG